jgi:hypothetical protein
VVLGVVVVAVLRPVVVLLLLLWSQMVVGWGQWSL